MIVIAPAPLVQNDGHRIQNTIGYITEKIPGAELLIERFQD